MNALETKVLLSLINQAARQAAVIDRLTRLVEERGCVSRITAPIAPTELARRMVFAREKAAQAWCEPTTSDRLMDVALAEAFAGILVAEMYLPKLGCATTGELLRELEARIATGSLELDYSTIGGSHAHPDSRHASGAEHAVPGTTYSDPVYARNIAYPRCVIRESDLLQPEVGLDPDRREPRLGAPAGIDAARDVGLSAARADWLAHARELCLARVRSGLHREPGPGAGAAPEDHRGDSVGPGGEHPGNAPGRLDDGGTAARADCWWRDLDCEDWACRTAQSGNPCPDCLDYKPPVPAAVVAPPRTIWDAADVDPDTCPDEPVDHAAPTARPGPAVGVSVGGRYREGCERQGDTPLQLGACRYCSEYEPAAPATVVAEPPAATRVCVIIDCGCLAEPRSAYCETHQQERRRAERAEYQRRRREKRKVSAEPPPAALPVEPFPVPRLVSFHKACTRCNQQKTWADFAPGYEGTIDQLDFLCSDCRARATAEKAARAGRTVHAAAAAEGA
jgi:hypothetical protein